MYGVVCVVCVVCVLRALEIFGCASRVRSSRARGAGCFGASRARGGVREQVQESVRCVYRGKWGARVLRFLSR